MERGSKYLAGGIIVLGLVTIGATFLPGREGKINRLCYWLDPETCIGLAGAEFITGDIPMLAAECTNLSSVALGILVEFQLTYPDSSIDTDAISLPMQPNQTTIFDYPAVLNMTGNYELTVIMYEEETMRRLDSKSVSFFAREPVGPAEFVVANLRIIPTTLEINNVINIYATVTNIGGLAGTHTIYMTGDLSGHHTTGVLNPGQSQELNYYQMMSVAGIYNFEFGGLPGSFTVTSVAPPIEAAGHIAGFAAYLNNEWTGIADKTVDVPSTLELAVSWISDMTFAEPDIKGYVYLHVRVFYPGTDSLIAEYDVTPTSGQGTQVGPGGLASVFFDLTIDQEADYYLDAVLDGEIA